jgi:hypothetical protein
MFLFSGSKRHIDYLELPDDLAFVLFLFQKKNPISARITASTQMLTAAEIITFTFFLDLLTESAQEITNISLIMDTIVDKASNCVHKKKNICLCIAYILH